MKAHIHNTLILLALALALPLAITGCGDKDDTSAPPEADTDTDTDADADTDTDTDTDMEDTGPEPPPDFGWVQGTVELQLRDQDEDGDLRLLAWEDSCFEQTWPYGGIMVAVWVADEETGEPRWLGSDTILYPSQDGGQNSYSIEFENPGSWEVHVAAFLDKWQDRIIGSSDPVAPTHEPVTLAGDGGINDDVNLVIDTPYWCGAASGESCPDCPPSWGDGAAVSWNNEAWVVTATCCAEFVDIAGTFELTTPYTGTGDDGIIAFMQEGTGDPGLSSTELRLEPTAHGATGAWDVSHCSNRGTFDLRGAWDSNGNTLWDFTDSWGVPVDAHGKIQDSVTIGEEDIAGLRVIAPTEGAAPAVTPEVQVSGEIRLDGGFDALLADHPGARLWVVAMREGFALDEHGVSLVEINDARGHQVWEPAELTAQDSLDFDLTLPGHGPVHLGAWMDLNGDDLVDGAAEPCGWWGGGDPHGMLEVDDSDLAGLVVEIQVP